MPKRITLVEARRQALQILADTEAALALERLRDAQEPLGAEFEQVLNDHFYELLVYTNTPQENSMSRWTHVSGIIRIDHLGILGPLDVDTHFRAWDFDSPKESIDQSNMPSGSEGSIQRQIWQNPHESSLAAYTVSLWGDLRDFGEAAHMALLQTWFQDTCAKFPMIRQAFLLAEDEADENSFVLRCVHNDPAEAPQWRCDMLCTPATDAGR